MRSDFRPGGTAGVLADGMAGREDGRPPPEMPDAWNCIVQGPAPGVPHPPALQRRGKPGGGLWRAGRGQLIARRAPPPGPTDAEYVRAVRAPYAHTLPCTRCAGEKPSWRSCLVHSGHPRAP